MKFWTKSIQCHIKKGLDRNRKWGDIQEYSLPVLWGRWVVWRVFAPRCLLTPVVVEDFGCHSAHFLSLPGRRTYTSDGETNQDNPSKQKHKKEISSSVSLREIHTLLVGEPIQTVCLNRNLKEIYHSQSLPGRKTYTSDGGTNQDSPSKQKHERDISFSVSPREKDMHFWWGNQSRQTG